ncbi:MAG: YdcF family protein [Pirellula sp.]
MKNTTHSNPHGNSIFRDLLKCSFFIGAVTVLLPIVGTALTSGKSSAEKMITNIVQPFFLFIVITMVVGATLWSRREKLLGGILIAVAAAVWCVSSPFFVKTIVAYWESLIELTDETLAPFDYVVVLGGGTSVSPYGRPQLAASGDRVAYAAIMFHKGNARRIVTTGDILVMTGNSAAEIKLADDPSHQSKQILCDLGIPEDAILELSGENTSKEMAALKDHPEWWKDQRCGLITSAFHMPRAMQLAKRNGIHLLPISVDYRTSNDPFMLKEFVPDVAEIARLNMILKEWIAMRLGR